MMDVRAGADIEGGANCCCAKSRRREMEKTKGKNCCRYKRAEESQRQHQKHRTTDEPRTLARPHPWLLLPLPSPRLKPRLSPLQHRQPASHPPLLPFLLFDQPQVGQSAGKVGEPISDVEPRRWRCCEGRAGRGGEEEGCVD